MNKLILGMLIAFALVMSVIGSGCIGLWNSVDVHFETGQYEQYDYVTSWDIIKTETFYETSWHTVDLHFVYGKTIRLHYVASIDIID